MSIQDFFDSCEDVAEFHGHGHIKCEVRWSRKGTGFGGFYFYYDENGKLRCENEWRSKEFIKEVLCDLVDEAELDDPRD